MTNFNTIDSDGFTAFLNKVKKENPVLSHNELVALVEKMHSGDKAAKEKIILSNFGLIQQIASECRIPGVCLEDKFYSAMDKFIQVIENFNPSICPYLSNFVWLTVRQAVYDDLLVMPQSLYKFSSKIIKLRAEFEAEYNRQPSNAELAFHLGVSEKRLSAKLAQIAEYNVKSLDAVVGDDESCDSYNFVASESSLKPESSVLEEDRKTSVNRAMAHLPEAERELITLFYDENNRFGRTLTYREIGKLLGISHQTVSNRLKVSVSHFKKVLERYGE